MTDANFGFKSLLNRMMGFGEEEGVIPRFSEELFSRLASMENEAVTPRVEVVQSVQQRN